MKERISLWFEETFLNVLREALKKGIQAFTTFVWENIKGDVRAGALEAIKYLSSYFGTDTCRNNVDLVLDQVMKKIKVPLIFKPFKGIIKRKFKKEIEKIVQNILTKGIELLG